VNRVVLTLTFLGVAGAILVLSPLVLTAGRWQVRHPRTALTLWFSAFLTGTGFAAASVITALTSSVIARDASNSVESFALTAAGWGSLGVVGALIAFVSASAEPLTQSWRESVGRFAPVAIAREGRGVYTLVWFCSDDPIACAVPSRSPEILVSTGLRELLSPPQLAAVLAHEHAHLRQRHGWAVRIAEINALCLPRSLRAGRALKRATLLLIELIADDTAAKHAGAVHLANALATMGRTTADPGLELRADRLTLRKWPSTRHHRYAAAARA
jgi:Zn-dependent protease with chaperone function